MKNYRFGAERLEDILKHCIGVHYKCRGDDHAADTDASAVVPIVS